MIAEEARAEVFWLAFKGLPKKEQQLIVQKLLQDQEFIFVGHSHYRTAAFRTLQTFGGVSC